MTPPVDDSEFVLPPLDDSERPTHSQVDDLPWRKGGPFPQSWLGVLSVMILGALVIGIYVRSEDRSPASASLGSTLNVPPGRGLDAPGLLSSLAAAATSSPHKATT